MASEKIQSNVTFCLRVIFFSETLLCHKKSFLLENNASLCPVSRPSVCLEEITSVRADRAVMLSIKFDGLSCKEMNAVHVVLT